MVLDQLLCLLDFEERLLFEQTVLTSVNIFMKQEQKFSSLRANRNVLLSSVVGNIFFGQNVPVLV